MKLTVVNEASVLPLGSAWEKWRENDRKRRSDDCPDLASANVDAHHRP